MVHKLKAGARADLDDFAQELSQANSVGSAHIVPKRMNQIELDNAIFDRRTLRRSELRKIIPLSDTTIYELEQKGDFPKRFYLTARCVVWPLSEVLAWIDRRKVMTLEGTLHRAPHPDVMRRKARPVQDASA